MYQLDKEAFGEFLQGLRKEKGLYGTLSPCGYLNLERYQEYLRAKRKEETA